MRPHSKGHPPRAAHPTAGCRAVPAVDEARTERSDAGGAAHVCDGRMHAPKRNLRTNSGRPSSDQKGPSPRSSPQCRSRCFGLVREQQQRRGRRQHKSEILLGMGLRRTGNRDRPEPLAPGPFSDPLRRHRPSGERSSRRRCPRAPNSGECARPAGAAIGGCRGDRCA